jgi:flagellar biosynthesis protein FlhG
MKPFSEMTHYELLEVRPDASKEDVERAYRMARSTFADDSLATYSVYDPKEAEFIQERVELAYQVLGDAEQRAEYDARLGTTPSISESVEIAFDLEAEAQAAPAPAPEVAPEIAGFEDLDELEGGGFDGSRLRRVRLRRGIELEKIATVTKIGPTYLRFIEEEQFDDLPAPVYVRGFVTAYARCVGLDPERVVPAYMERLQSLRPSASPSRGRRG